MLRYIYVETDTRRPLYLKDGATGELKPWFFDQREGAEDLLNYLSPSPEGSGTGRPLTREWIDVVGLDEDNFAKYAEWNWPAEGG